MRIGIRGMAAIFAVHGLMARAMPPVRIHVINAPVKSCDTLGSHLIRLLHHAIRAEHIHAILCRQPTRCSKHVYECRSRKFTISINTIKQGRYCRSMKQ